MTLLNGSQQIISVDNQVKLITEDNSVICSGKNIGDCIQQLLMMLKCEAIQKMRR